MAKRLRLVAALRMGARSKVVFGNPMTAYSTAYSIPNDLSISARIAHFPISKLIGLFIRLLIQGLIF
jgi:hypothetical protein